MWGFFFLIFFFLWKPKFWTVYSVYSTCILLLNKTAAKSKCVQNTRFQSQDDLKSHLIDTNVFSKKKETTSTKSNPASSSAKCSSVYFLMQNYAACFLQGSFLFTEIWRKPLFSVSFYFPLSLSSPCRHVSPCPALSEHFQSSLRISFNKFRFQFHILTHSNLNMCTYIWNSFLLLLHLLWIVLKKTPKPQLKERPKI